MNGPSAHLTWGELKCKDGTSYPNEFRKDGRAYRLARAFEEIRHGCGDDPIEIWSAYRTPAWNRKIGGTTKSFHLKGMALDLHHTILTNEEFFRIIHANAENFEIGGIGKYKRFVHIDIRNSERLIVWRSTMRKDTPV